MPRGAGISARKLRNASLFFIFWLMPLAWVALTPPITPAYKPAAATRHKLAQSHKTLQTYVEKFQKTPADLNVIRAFAASEHLPFSAFDGFGQRLDYLRLDEAHYLFRSFGEDGEQNTTSSAPDMGVVRWGEMPETGLTYKYPAAPTPDVYPAVLLDGADSPDHQWMARLFVDSDGKSRQLLVRHRTKSGFMVARHDGIEQFLWLPDGRRVVYSASGSSRFRDGLYIWNLADDSVVNLIDYAGQSLPLSPSAKGLNLWFMLSGIAKQDGESVIYSYFWPRHDGGLNPVEFFGKSQVLAFAVPDKPSALPRLIPQTALPATFDKPPYTETLKLSDHLEGAGGIKSQQEWVKLDVDGELEQVLLAWHQFSEQRSQSALFPYSLWVLAALYGQSSQLMASKGSPDAEVLQTFGTEIARALINDDTAPTVLKGMALYAYESLMEGEALPYRFAKLLPAPFPVAPPAVPETPLAPKTPSPAPPATPAPADTN